MIKTTLLSDNKHSKDHSDYPYKSIMDPDSVLLKFSNGINIAASREYLSEKLDINPTPQNSESNLLYRRLDPSYERFAGNVYSAKNRLPNTDVNVSSNKIRFLNTRTYKDGNLIIANMCSVPTSSETIGSDDVVYRNFPYLIISVNNGRTWHYYGSDQYPSTTQIFNLQNNHLFTTTSSRYRMFRTNSNNNDVNVSIDQNVYNRGPVSEVIDLEVLDLPDEEDNGETIIVKRIVTLCVSGTFSFTLRVSLGNPDIVDLNERFIPVISDWSYFAYNLDSSNLFYNIKEIGFNTSIAATTNRNKVLNTTIQNYQIGDNKYFSFPEEFKDSEFGQDNINDAGEEANRLYLKNNLHYYLFDILAGVRSPTLFESLYDTNTNQFLGLSFSNILSETSTVNGSSQTETTFEFYVFVFSADIDGANFNPKIQGIRTSIVVNSSLTFPSSIVSTEQNILTPLELIRYNTLTDNIDRDENILEFVSYRDSTNGGNINSTIKTKQFNIAQDRNNNSRVFVSLPRYNTSTSQIGTDIGHCIFDQIVDVNANAPNVDLPVPSYLVSTPETSSIITRDLIENFTNSPISLRNIPGQSRLIFTTKNSVWISDYVTPSSRIQLLTGYVNDDGNYFFRQIHNWKFFRFSPELEENPILLSFYNRSIDQINILKFGDINENEATNRNSLIDVNYTGSYQSLRILLESDEARSVTRINNLLDRYSNGIDIILSTIYYKTQETDTLNSRWIDITNEFQTASFFTSMFRAATATTPLETIRTELSNVIDLTKEILPQDIPSVEYTDSEGYISNIPPGDNARLKRLELIDIGNSYLKYRAGENIDNSFMDNYPYVNNQLKLYLRSFVNASPTGSPTIKNNELENFLTTDNLDVVVLKTSGTSEIPVNMQNSCLVLLNGFFMFPTHITTPKDSNIDVRNLESSVSDVDIIRIENSSSFVSFYLADNNYIPDITLKVITPVDSNNKIYYYSMQLTKTLDVPFNFRNNGGRKYN